MKILYVEDNSLDADLTCRELTHHAPTIQVDVAPTLAEARARLTQSPPYDLVLADLRLPDGTGLDLLGGIREQGLPLAVVILTGSGDEEAAMAALRAGADDYLAKRQDYLARLPLALENALAHFQAEAARKEQTLRVLYAEHNAADIDFTYRHLARYAPHVHLDVVHTAREVLERLPSDDAEPCSWDILLLDYRLPRSNTLELLKILRQDRHLDLPVVFVTGHGDEDVATQAWRLGATDYVVKSSGYLFKLPVILENAFHRVKLVREQAALRESEARYRRMAENAQDVIYRYRLLPTPGTEYVNPAVTTVLGYTPEEFYTDPELGSSLIHPDDWSLLEQLAAEGVSDLPVVLRWIRRDDVVIWLEHHNVLVYDEQRNLVALEGIARDITERKQAQIAEHEQRVLAEALADTASALISALDLDTVMSTILENVAQVVPHDAANIVLIENDQARPVYWRGYWPDPTRPFGDLCFSVVETPSLRQMYETGSPFLVSYTDQFAGWVHDPLTDWVKSYVSAPIRSHGNVIGFLNLDSAEPGFFTEDHAQRLQAFADQASIAIEHAQLYEEIRRHTDELEQRVEERTAQLNRAKDHIEAILNSSNDVIILCQTNGIINQINPIFEKTFNRQREDVYGQPLSTLVVPPHVRNMEQAFAAVVETGQPRRLETTVHGLQHTAFDADVVLSPIVEQDNRLSGVICSLRDITERKRMEAQLRQMLEHEMELSELKSRYVSMAAHDLRNPLAVIQGAIGLLQQYNTRLTEEQKQSRFDRIKTSIQVMLDMLDDILTIGQVESGKLTFNPAPLDLMTFCHTVMAEMGQAVGPVRAIDFSSQGDCGIEWLDAKLLRHILGNLLSNALKYSPPESTVTFILDCQPDRFTFRIRDRGIGIPKGDQGKLFDAFHRGSNTRQLPGTGLGLAIVKQSVDLHGGIITFESKEHVGTTFTVVLPRCTPSAPAL